MSRTICWFSCGAASAVATKLILSEKGIMPVEVAYTRVAEEHDDNERFLKDCGKWFGRPITRLQNEKYSGSIYEVFLRERYIKGHQGAPCTKLLKRAVRAAYQRPGDVHVFGFTAEEQGRADEFTERNAELVCRFPLIERGVTKADCLAMIQDAGIKLPAMYLLGYQNNNCRGCVKGGMGYWNKVRVDFPEYFQRMAKTEREIGHALLKDDAGPVYLDELEPGRGNMQDEPAIECGIFCEAAKQEYAA